MQNLCLRHEKEHARKSDLVYKTAGLSPFGRAEVAALDEIVAPASELIEAIDYRTRTGKSLSQKEFITRADLAIQQIPGAMVSGRVNFNYQPVADIVITYALENFLESVGRGYYTKSIRMAYYRERPRKQQFQTPGNFFTFNPDMNNLAPIWDLESDAGKCNPYQYASQHVRQKLMQAIDSVICSVTDADKIATFHRNAFIR